jgi:hypothetical protein
LFSAEDRDLAIDRGLVLTHTSLMGIRVVGTA